MFECATCDDEFWDQDDCDEHMDDYNHWCECETCPRRFRSRRACVQHMNSLDHYAPTFECETCNRTFRSQNAANQHMNSVDHWAPSIPCETCTMTFTSDAAADRHMQANGHFKNFCHECNRRFQNENNLRAHMNSQTHRGKGVTCPFCQAGFVTASGASHHVESGACPQARNWNRETVYRAIRSLDPNGVVTKKQIGWHDEHNVKYVVSNAAFNGTWWVCYLCKKCFSSKNGLNMHINSPVHKEKIYHCLNKRGQCRKEFGSLAALFNHLESEICGYTRFENVQNVHRQLNDAVRGNRMITGF